MSAGVEATTDTAPLALRSIDHGAIARNVARLLDASGVPLMAVVKSDGFGHGAIEVARTALAAGASWLGVATIEEALALRAAAIAAPIFAWLVDPWCDLDAAVRRGITLSCANLGTLAAIEDAANRAQLVADVHLELDTGMARGGSSPVAWPSLCAAAAEAEAVGRVRVSGVWSHLAMAGLPEAQAVSAPVDALLARLALAQAAGLSPRDVHIANSAGILAHPSTHLTMVRSAAALYGIETVAGRSHGLEPAMRLTSRVTQLRRIPAGTGVGYLHTWRAPVATTLALIPIGYADGVPRALSEGGSVSIDGVRCPVRGTISMDQLVVEVPDATRIADEVVLIGDPRRGEPTAAEWAALAGTLPHDILAGIGARVDLRHHTDGGIE
ncbi:MAG TPA: alanine racemase [Galbitalea sp.]|jgi:alanine racemase